MIPTHSEHLGELMTIALVIATAIAGFIAGYLLGWYNKHRTCYECGAVLKKALCDDCDNKSTGEVLE